MKRIILAAVLFAASASTAAAYTSYLKPEEFWVTDATVRVEGAYAQQFFTPSIALGDTVVVVNPAGQSEDQLAPRPNGTSIVQPLMTTGGTYRVSTGEVLGQVANLVGENGQWRVLGATETAPEGAETTTLQTVTVADTYITRGTANRAAVDQTIGRLAIRPVTHPNQVLASQGFQIQLLFDGAPMPNSAVVIYAEGDPETKLDRYVVTDAEGNATFTFDAPGRYIIAARHRADMPAGSPAAVGSYTTTLTFEALPQLYTETEVRDTQAEPERPARERRPARRRVGRPDL